MGKGVCQNCVDRKIGCHGVCKEYLQWQQEHREQNEKIRKEVLNSTNISNFRDEQVRKAKRRRGK